MKQINITIRTAIEADYPRILELFAEFAEFEKLPHLMTNSLERMQAEKEFFHAFVAVNEAGLIVGYATWFFAYFTWSGKSIYMDDLYVQPDFRGCGIGKRLLTTVAEWGKASGCHKFRWQVSDWNVSAIGFYERLGAERDLINRNCDFNL